jgi:polyhydroxybutyrate depolymerase
MARRSECRPPKLKVSVLIIQGTADPIVPFLGGAIMAKGKSTGSVTGAIASRDWWLKVDRLEDAPLQKSHYAHHPASGETNADRETWGEDRGPQVSLITVGNGGHIEPSLRFHAGWLYTKLVGQQNQDFESADEAWAFFKPKTR